MLHETTTLKNQKTPVEVFIAESVQELVAAVTKGNETHSMPIGHRVSDRSFLGRRFDSWKNVEEACRSPWEDGLEIIKGMLDTLGHCNLPKPVSRKRRPSFDEADGDELDYDRLRCGQPFWRKLRRQNAKGPATITIITDMRAACHVDHEEILWRGAAAILLTYLLEAAGYRVELWSAQAEQNAFKDADMFVAVRIKKHGEPVDLGNLVAAVSAWFYRLIGFQSANMVASREPTCYCGYDRPQGVRPFINYMTSAEKPVVVEGVWSRSQAIEFVKKTINSITNP